MGAVRKGVSFGEVRVRQHARVLGDHPSCVDSLPLSLGWDVPHGDLVYSLDEYEAQVENVQECDCEKPCVATATVDTQSLENRRVMVVKRKTSITTTTTTVQRALSQHDQEETHVKQPCCVQAKPLAQEEFSHAKAKRLTYEERKELLLASGVDLASNRADQRRRRRRVAMQAALKVKQQTSKPLIRSFSSSSSTEDETDDEKESQQRPAPQPCMMGTSHILALLSMFARRPQSFENLEPPSKNKSINEAELKQMHKQSAGRKRVQAL